MNFLDGPHILAMGLSGNNVWRRACSLLQRSAFTYSCPLQPALGHMCHVNERVCAEEHHVWERYPEVRSGLLVFVDCFSCPLDCDYSEGRAILRLSHHIPCTHQDRLGGPALTRQPGPSVAFMTSADKSVAQTVCVSISSKAVAGLHVLCTLASRLTDGVALPGLLPVARGGGWKHDGFHTGP